MTKPLVSVAITLVDGSTTKTASDSVKAGVGGAVLASLLAGQDLHFNDGTDELFIPFHSVLYAVITRTTTEVEKPVDSLCVEESDAP